MLKTTAYVKILFVKLLFKLYFAPKCCESIVSMRSVMKQQRELLHYSEEDENLHRSTGVRGETRS